MFVLRGCANVRSFAKDFAGALQTLRQVQKLPGSHANLEKQIELLQKRAAGKESSSPAARRRLADLASPADRHDWEPFMPFSLQDSAAAAPPTDMGADPQDSLPSQQNHGDLASSPDGHALLQDLPSTIKNQAPRAKPTDPHAWQRVLRASRAIHASPAAAAGKHGWQQELLGGQRQHAAAGEAAFSQNLPPASQRESAAGRPLVGDSAQLRDPASTAHQEEDTAAMTVADDFWEGP